MRVELTKRARQQLHKLSPDMQKRVVQKLYWFTSQNNPLSFARQLTNPRYGKYRFRIGDYRVICDIEEREIRVLLVLSISHRNKAYEDI